MTQPFGGFRALGIIASTTNLLHYTKIWWWSFAVTSTSGITEQKRKESDTRQGKLKEETRQDTKVEATRHTRKEQATRQGQTKETTADKVERSNQTSKMEEATTNVKNDGRDPTKYKKKEATRQDRKKAANKQK